MVEFALVLPLLILLVLGIAEFGRGYYIQATISGAAREAARTMALAHDASPTIDQTAARASAKSAASNLPLTDTQVDVKVLDANGVVVTPGTCVTDSASNPDSTRTVAVTVSYDLTFITNQLGPTIKLNGTGVMRCNG